MKKNKKNPFFPVVLANFFATQSEKELFLRLAFYLLPLILFLGVLVVALLAFAAKKNKTNFGKKITLGNLLKEKYPAIEAETPLKTAYDLMESQNLSTLPVVKANRVKGIIRKTAIERKIRNESRVILETKNASDLISRDISELKKTDTLDKALALIAKSNPEIIVITGLQDFYLGALSKSKLIKIADQLKNQKL